MSNENAEAFAKRYPAAARVAKVVRMNGGTFEGMVKLGFAAKLIEPEADFLANLREQVSSVYWFADECRRDPTEEKLRDLQDRVHVTHEKVRKRKNKIRPDNMSECHRVESAEKHGLIVRLTPVYARIAKFEITDFGREVAKYA